MWFFWTADHMPYSQVALQRRLTCAEIPLLTTSVSFSLYISQDFEVSIHSFQYIPSKLDAGIRSNPSRKCLCSFLFVCMAQSSWERWWNRPHAVRSAAAGSRLQTMLMYSRSYWTLGHTSSLFRATAAYERRRLLAVRAYCRALVPRCLKTRWGF